MGDPVWILVVVVAGTGLASLIAVVVVATLTQGRRGRWQVRCTTCGRVRPAEEIGIVRIGARSRWKRTVGRCSACDALRLLAVERAAEADGDAPP